MLSFMLFNHAPICSSQTVSLHVIMQYCATGNALLLIHKRLLANRAGGPSTIAHASNLMRLLLIRLLLIRLLLIRLLLIRLLLIQRLLVRVQAAWQYMARRMGGTTHIPSDEV